MKRIVALLMILGVLSLGMISAFAAENDVLTMTLPENGSCAPGSTITVSLGLAENTRAQAINVELSYNTSVFQFVEYQNGALISEFDALAAGNCAGGKVLFTFATMSPVTKGGEILSVTFKVDSKATGDHNFYFYSTSFNVDDGSSAGKDIKANSVQKTMKVQGSAVSNVTVEPVYSTDDKGNKVVVEADDGAGATGVTVDSTVNTQNTDSSNQNNTNNGSSANGNSVWIWIAIGALGVGAVALLVIALVSKKKKTDPVEHQSILDKEAKDFIELTISPVKEDEE